MDDRGKPHQVLRLHRLERRSIVRSKAGNESVPHKKHKAESSLLPAQEAKT